MLKNNATAGKRCDHQININGVPLSEVLDPRADDATELILGYCHVCGHRTVFYGYAPVDFPCKRNTLVCKVCGSCGRNRHLTRCILDAFPVGRSVASLKEWVGSFRGSIFQTCTSGAIADILRGHDGFVASEYVDGAHSGDVVNGIRCEDLHRTSFADESLDLVITEDVLEHVADPRQAFLEIRRILRPGGYHIGTIPVNWQRETTASRAVVENGEIRHLMEPEYHGDPTRPKGILAFTEYGRDIAEKWCGIIGPTIEDKLHGDIAGELAFGIHYSCVFVSRKPD